jgi:peptidoglycan hydrolase CwlO-like protein
MSGDDRIVERVAVRVRELEAQLETFSERLRTMRRRNRELEDEIAAFEAEIDELRAWLAERREADPL